MRRFNLDLTLPDALLRPYRIARRIVIAVVGFTVLLIGLIMMVTPGPALVVVPLGLGILALEFAWARHWLHKLRAEIARRSEQFKNARRRPHKDPD